MPNDQNQPPQENNVLDPTARRNARRYALQAMYQWQVAGAPVADIEAEFLKHQIDKKIDLAYFKELIYGVTSMKLEIDDEMRPFLGRGVHEIDPVELAVLRIAIYEILKRPDVPYRVVINEALELAKKFGSVEGHKFVNGILDRVAKKNRTIEIKD